MDRSAIDFLTDASDSTEAAEMEPESTQEAAPQRPSVQQLMALKLQ